MNHDEAEVFFKSSISALARNDGVRPREALWRDAGNRAGGGGRRYFLVLCAVLQGVWCAGCVPVRKGPGVIMAWNEAQQKQQEALENIYRTKHRIPKREESREAMKEAFFAALAQGLEQPASSILSLERLNPQGEAKEPVCVHFHCAACGRKCPRTWRGELKDVVVLDYANPEHRKAMDTGHVLCPGCKQTLNWRQRKRGKDLGQKKLKLGAEK